MHPDDRTGANRELSIPAQMIPESAIPSPDAREDRYLGTSSDQRERHAPYFEAEWYLAQNPDVRDAGLDPLSHYLTQGHREDRDPSPLFDNAYYRRAHMGSSDECPLMHYVRLGRFEGLRCRPEGANVHPERANARPKMPVSAQPELAAAVPAAPAESEAQPQHQDARFLGVSPEVRAECAPYFDSEWFLERNIDVLKSGLDALSHYLTQGHLERRNPSPFFDSAHYRQRYMAGSDECPLVHYARIGRHRGLQPHPLIDPEYVASTHSVPLQDVLKLITARSPLIDSLCEWFSPKLYSQLHRDVTIDPVEHFASAGLAEGRRPHPSFTISKDPSSVPLFRHQLADGQIVNVVRASLPPVVIDQIMAQGAVDPMVFAPGHRAIPNLVQRRASSVVDREGFDHRKLLDSIGCQPDAVVLHPALAVGGADKYMAKLVQALERDLGMRPLVITTRASAESDRAALSLEILKPLRPSQVLSLQPHFVNARDPVLSLSMLMLALHPAYAFVINSELGLECISRYGRALSSAMRLFVSFFSESVVARGAWFPARYLVDVIPHSHVFADNQRILDRLSDRLGGQMGDRFSLLPQAIELSDEDQFERVLAARRSRPIASARAMWMSRWRPAKAIDVLEILATLRPDVAIDAFGVDDTASFPSLPNLHRHPVVLDPDRLPLGAYDAFIFTSRFEGMPNVVLEMAGRGIPVIASDVGGLRETLDDSAIDYVSMTGTPAQIASAFSEALNRVRSRSAADTEVRLRHARASVARRHSSAAFLARIRGALA